MSEVHPAAVRDLLLLRRDDPEAYWSDPLVRSCHDDVQEQRASGRMAVIRALDDCGMSSPDMIRLMQGPVN